MTRRLILNADDLGLAPEVNTAIEQGHRDGILTSASLMVGAAAVADGVDVARRNPRLAIGLHLTLTDGRPILPPDRIPALVQSNGRFRDDMAALGLIIAASRRARAQLGAEVAAQFAAFAATGLRCDHINAHKHFHLHPVIGGIALREAAAHGVRAVRIPWEPPAMIRAAEPGTKTQPRALYPFSLPLRRLAAKLGLGIADQTVGLAWSGAFTTERLLSILPHLPEGNTELYFHPGTTMGFPAAAPGYRYPEELAALLDPRVREAVAGFETGGYTAILAK